MWRHRHPGGTPCEDRRRVQSDSATSQGIAGTARTWKRHGRRDPPFGDLLGAWPCQHLHFKVSRTLRQDMSVLLSHPVCGTLLWQLWGTKACLPSPLPTHRPRAPSSLLKSFPGPQRRVTWDYLILGICKLSHNVDMEDICRNWILYGNLEAILIT